MYTGNYDANAVYLKKELDRKRMEGEKAEIILYDADYEFLNSWNKDVRETRVIKTIYDNGQIIHGVYNGVDIDDKAPDNLENINSNNDFDAFYNGFWCAESEVPTDANEVPCEIYIDGECVNDKALKEWAKNYDNLIMLEKELTIKFHADIEEKNIKAIEQDFQKSGAKIIVYYFPKLSNIGNFNITVLGDSKFNDKKEIEVIFYADVDKNNFQSVKRDLQQSGAAIIGDNFSALNNISYLKIFESQKLNTLNAKLAEEADCVKHIEKKTFEQDFSELCKKHNVSPKKAIKAMLNKMADDKNKQNGSQR